MVLYNSVCIFFINKIIWFKFEYIWQGKRSVFCLQRPNYFILFYSYVETSGKWPTALDALQRVKAAFCLQIARGLRKKFHLRTKVNVDSVDVIKGKFYDFFSIRLPNF